MTSFYLATLGCKLNQAEAEAWGREIEAAGHRLTDDPAQADWEILNTWP
jgi:tRNA A37 methylthiotransferase MiaB